MEKIQIREVCKTFGKKEARVQALRGVTLSIREGEMAAIMGKSGSGKSTLLNILGGMMSMDSGEYLYDGNAVNFKSQRDLTRFRRNEIGFVVQYFALVEDINVFKNVALPLKYQGYSGRKIREMVMEALRELGIEDKAKAYPSELSGGQQQRVALARALVIQPDVLLMDEPLSNLDAKLRVEMRTVIKNIQKEVGITTVYVTHDQEEAMAISDRIAVMKDGVIRHCGEPKNIYQRPADLFVATFIGKSNLLNAKLMQKGREAVLEFPNGYRICMDSVQDSEIRERDVTLSVRPEELFVQKCTEGERKEGISAKIMDSVFLGSNTHYFVELETGETAEIIQESEIDEIIPPGRRVLLTLNSRKANIFDPETTKSLMKGIKNSTDIPRDEAGREVSG